MKRRRKRRGSEESELDLQSPLIDSIELHTGFEESNYGPEALEKIWPSLPCNDDVSSKRFGSHPTHLVHA